MAFFDQDLFASSVANKDYARATDANAATQQAVASNRQAGVAEGRMGSQNFRDRAEGQAALNGSAGIGGLRDAEAYRTNQEGAQVGPNAESQRNLQSQQGGFYGAQTRSLNDLGGYSKGTPNVPDRPATPAEMHFFHQHLLAAKQGATKVPGKGPSTVDTVPAMLAPREAVLNEHAADLIGRDKIAAANAIGVAHQKAQGKGMVSSRPAQPKPQKMSGGTHMVGHGKSAKTPTKIDPQALLSLMGAMQGGQAGQAGGPPQAPMQGPGGMV